MQKKFRDATKLLQSWEVTKKTKLLEKKANEKSEKVYNKIVYGNHVRPEDMFKTAQP